MAETRAVWQLECETVQQRCGHLLKSGLWSDCTFMVGSEPNQEEIKAHKLLMAMASPVFDAMFYGGLAKPLVIISDVEPEVFRALLEYIYTGVADIGSFNIACDLWYAAKMYMLPHLEKLCISYICTVVGPRTACQTYELAHLLEEKTVMDKCMEVISANTKEILNDDSFVDVQLHTLITVCSLYHLDVDSELDLFHAVARYAEAGQRRQGQISPPIEGGPSSEELSKKASQSDGSISQTSSAVAPDSKPPTEVVPSKPTADSKKFKEGLISLSVGTRLPGVADVLAVKCCVSPKEARKQYNTCGDEDKKKPSIRTALQNLRFLSLTAAEFSEGMASSDLLTKDETLAVLMNIASEDSPVPMPAGFSECRQRRQPCRDLKKSFDAAALDHIINSLKCGDPSHVTNAARDASNVLLGTSLKIQPALDKGILEALIPVLTNGSDECKTASALSFCRVCKSGSPAQLRVLAKGDALLSFFRLMPEPFVLNGLRMLLKKVGKKVKRDLVRRLEALGWTDLDHYDDEDNVWEPPHYYCGFYDSDGPDI